MCLGALRGEHSLKVAHSAHAVRTQCKDSPKVKKGKKYIEHSLYPPLFPDLPLTLLKQTTKETFLLKCRDSVNGSCPPPTPNINWKLGPTGEISPKIHAKVPISQETKSAPPPPPPRSLHGTLFAPQKYKVAYGNQHSPQCHRCFFTARLTTLLAMQFCSG